MAKKKILFVDDEPNVLEGLRRMLHNESDMWDLSFTDNPRTAKDLLLEEPFDVVVSDFNMPGRDGIDLLVDLKSDERTHGLEVILLTGIADENLKHEAIDLGAIDLLRKPVVKHELMARLRSALRIKGYRDELKEKNAVLEQELIRSQKAELAGLLAAGAADDLNNILTAIVGYTSLARGTAGQVGPQELAPMVAKIERAGLRATKIVRQIINFTKNRQSMPEICSFSKIVQECVEMLQICISRRIHIAFEDATRSSLMRANGTEIYQVVMNICINGVQAMGDEGTLSIKLKESEFQGGDDLPIGLAGSYLELAISDTGSAGMDTQTLNQAFDKGFTTKEDRGCGLGLSIVQRIVQNHGGCMRAESVNGQGTTVSVFLPAEQENISLVSER